MQCLPVALFYKQAATLHLSLCYVLLQQCVLGK
jgi:hypothetical protein